MHVAGGTPGLDRRRSRVSGWYLASFLACTETHKLATSRETRKTLTEGEDDVEGKSLWGRASHIDSLRAALDTARAPDYMYCKTGMASGIWAHAPAQLGLSS